MNDDEDKTDMKMLWIGAYLVALHAEMSKPRHETYTTTEPPAGGMGGTGVTGGGTIHRTAVSDSYNAATAADLAIKRLDEFNKQVEGR